MDRDVADLVAAERVKDAAELAAKKGDAATASELFERACEFTSAANAALDSGDAERALALAVVARDDALAEKALAAVREKQPRRLASLASRLERRGDWAWAARAHEARGDAPREAAADWERAGEAVRAAALSSRGDPVAAAKVLEAALRRDPGGPAALVALGTLLVRYGKIRGRPSARSSGSRRGSPERRDALALLVRALERARALAGAP